MFILKINFGQKVPMLNIHPFTKARLPVLSVPSQYSVRYIISELHCLVTIFDAQAILSSDYFTY